MTEDAPGDTPITETVARLEPMMGRKWVRTGDPAEKRDRDIQEALVDLEGGDPGLVIDLRVTVIHLAPEVER